MTIMMTAPTSIAFAGALKKCKVYFSIWCLLIIAHSVSAAPAKLDSLGSTFPLDLQPPIFEAAASASTPAQPNGNREGTTVDSYGHPIESLKPIETPDGRKVVSAQGLQFEIPNYASGITELKKPAGDLLPPFVGEFSNNFDISATATDSVDDVGRRKDGKPGIRIISKDHAKADDSPVLVNTFLPSVANLSDEPKKLLRYKRQPQHITDTNNKNHNDHFTAQNINTNTYNINVANTTTKTLSMTKDKRLDRKLNTFATTTPPSSSTANSLSLFVSKDSNHFNSLNISSLSHTFSFSPLQFTNYIQSPSPKPKLSAHFTPISNGNFNYPNIPTDASVIDRIVSKYKNPLPTLDPIIVALPNASTESFSTNKGPTSSDETTSVDVESVALVELKSQPTSAHNVIAPLLKGLPDYILELNDPDIGGPVDYEPSDNTRGLNIIAWDLLPPSLQAADTTDKAISHSDKVKATIGHNMIAQASQESSHTTQRPTLGPNHSTATTSIPNYTQNRAGNFHARTKTTSTTTTTTPRTTTKPRTTSTTTPRTTTSTTRRTTTPRATTSTTTTSTTTTPAPDSSEFFKLEAGDSYTLPPWLQDIDDPELDVAVAFIVPDDINEYNHTIGSDILPPLEPYTDLNNLHLTPPTNYKETTTTTARTSATRKTTTKSPTTTTTRRATHWIRAKPTTAKPTIAPFNHQFTSLSPFISSSNFAQRTTSTTTTTTTTAKPKSFTNFHNRQLSSNTQQTDKIDSSDEEEVKANLKNSFLPTFDDGKYKPESTTRRITSTTTTTTPVPEIIYKNPFEPTLPPWLKDFDSPDLAPGVPFVYDPNEDENPVNKNILPPAKAEGSTKTNSPSTPPFLNSQSPQGFTNKFTSSAIPLASSSSIPSIVTIPIPSTQTNQDVSKFTRPPLVFVPPQPTPAEGSIIADKSDDDISIKTSSTFNKNFAAPFDRTSSSNSATATTGGDEKKVPLSADRESFPPFNNAITVSSPIPSKTTFTKSEDGKVITNNIFLTGGNGASSSKAIGSSQERNTSATSPTLTKATTSANASGFVTASGSSSTFSSSSSSDASKYTGRFGGPPGVLAPDTNGLTVSSTAATKSYNKPALTTVGATSAPGRAANNNEKFTGSFGGPPGVLKPYDNVKNRK